MNEFTAFTSTSPTYQVIITRTSFSVILGYAKLPTTSQYLLIALGAVGNLPWSNYPSYKLIAGSSVIWNSRTGPWNQGLEIWAPTT
jgi:hypothetical protein